MQQQLARCTQFVRAESFQNSLPLGSATVAGLDRNIGLFLRLSNHYGDPQHVWPGCPNATPSELDEGFQSLCVKIMVSIRGDLIAFQEKVIN